jgi:hypothetical protein
MKFQALAISTLAVIILSSPMVLAEKGGKKNRGAGRDGYGNGYGYDQAYYNGYGLPPGLAKRGGQLPPGLQKHLWKHGALPPGLQKKIGPAYGPAYYVPSPVYQPYPVYVPYPQQYAVPYNHTPARAHIRVSLDF